jgi:integrase/recombinase XerD
MTPSPSTDLIPVRPSAPPARLSPDPLPAIIAEAGAAAEFAWDEFFTAGIRNAHTRTAYRRAARRFLDWLAPQGVALTRITPGMVASYLDRLPGSPPTRKLHLAALRGLFDRLVTRHAMGLNPAATVRGERYQVIEGKTPEIAIDQARTLLMSVRTFRKVKNKQGETVEVPLVVGLRDRAIIGVLIYTAARAGAIAKLRTKHLAFDGAQWTLRFEEKGGKSREIPVRHDLQGFLLEYVDAAGLKDAPRDAPLFCTSYRRSGRLTANAMTGLDLCRMVKRRLRNASLPGRLSPHSFRVATVTDLLTQGVPLEEVQYLAGHADPRTTRLYDRRQKRVTRNVVERISI